MQENIMNIKQAHGIATGKDVTVSLLDHLFEKDNPVFKNRLYKPGCVVDGCSVFSTEGHGTWMARQLVKAAPDVKIMPVRIYGKNRFGDADLCIEGIHYAILQIFIRIRMD